MDAVLRGYRGWMHGELDRLVAVWHIQVFRQFPRGAGVLRTEK